MAKFSSEAHAAVSTAAAAAVIASATNGEEGMLPRGAWMTNTPPRFFSTSLAPAAPCRAPETTADGSHTYSLSSKLTSSGRSSDGAWQPSGGESSTSRMRPARVLAVLTVELHRAGRKVSVRGRDMKEARYCRGHATVAAPVGGGQPRGEAIWGRRTTRNGAYKTDGTNAV